MLVHGTALANLPSWRQQTVAELEKVVTLAALDPLIALAKEWQPLLAGILAVLASVIIAVAIVSAAKIRAAALDRQKKPIMRDLRSARSSAPADTSTYDSVNGNLEKLRSLLRSALSSLSSVNPDHETARALCNRIAAFQWQQFPIPANADRRIQEAYANLLNQFEQLRKILRQEWSSTEASSVLIQLNASARTLIDALGPKIASSSKLYYSLKQE